MTQETQANRAYFDEYTIKSRKLEREITFSRPGPCHIYVDLNGGHGALGQQICDGGYLAGSTIGYRGSDEARFQAICRSWYRAYLRRLARDEEA